MIKWITIAVIVFSIGLGVSFGLLIPNIHPPGQVYSFTSFAIHTATPVQCSPNPKNYSYWLGINVVGNRTAMNFQAVTVYSAGYNIRIDLPLNRTSFASYRVVNSTFETIYVGLPNYFNPGDVIQMSITYFISGYPPQSQTLTETPILGANQLAC